MRYKLEDGSFIEAATPSEVVAQLKNSRFVEEETNDAYIKGFSKRYEETTGIKLRCDSVDNFVEDLKRCNYLIPM